MQRPRLMALAALAWLAFARVGEAAQPPFELAVKQDHFLGSTRGTLVFTDDGVEFRTPDPKDTRRWTVLDVKQIRLRRTEIVIDTYEDRGRLRFGADRSYEFEVQKDPIPRELVAFLLERLQRPVVTTIMPPLDSQPLFRIPVKHQQRGRGSGGTLLLYHEGLAYATEREADARYWRFRDVFSVLQLDRVRLLVTAYEGGSGETRQYTFELKTDLSAAAYDALWQRVNAPLLPGGVGGER